MHKKIVLASSSPRRKQLLDTIRLKYQVDPPQEFDEVPQEKCTAKGLVEMNAKGKAKEVAKRHKDAIVIGVDTVGAFHDEILEKPKDEEDAFRMLKTLQGQTHEIYTGICMIDSSSGKEIYELDTARVSFDELSDDEIRNYIEKCEVMDKAAAYAIQGFASLFVKEIQGEYTGIVGLPMHRLFKMMKSFDINLLDIVN